MRVCKGCYREFGKSPQEQVAPVIETSATPDAVAITFNAYPIATAPKDREIMLYVPTHFAKWAKGKWDNQQYNRKPEPFWNYGEYRVTTMRAHQPTHWAELEDMRGGL